MQKPLVSEIAPLILRLTMLFLGVELALALLGGAQLAGADNLMLRAATVLILAVPLMPYPDTLNPSGVTRVLLWSLLCGVVLGTGAALSGFMPEFTREIVFLDAGLALLISMFGIVALFLAHSLGDRRRAIQFTVWLLLFALTLPLLMSPFVVIYGGSKWLVDSVIALCPLSYLATIIDIDYLRGSWFYQNSPYGGLRYDYPNPRYQSLGMLLAIAVLLCVSWLRGHFSPSLMRRKRS